MIVNDINVVHSIKWSCYGYGYVWLCMVCYIFKYPFTLDEKIIIKVQCAFLFALIYLGFVQLSTLHQLLGKHFGITLTLRLVNYLYHHFPLNQQAFFTVFLGHWGAVRHLWSKYNCWKKNSPNHSASVVGCSQISTHF